MDVYHLPDLLRQHDEAGQRYLEFLYRDALSLGIYVLPAGDTDPQNPHTDLSF